MGGHGQVEGDRRLIRVPVPSGRWALPILLLLAGALAVRVALLALTWGQPVWWDEAEYLLQARHLALGTPADGFSGQRPMLLSLVLSAFYALGLGEGAIRVALAAVSVGAVFLAVRAGEQLLGPRPALLAAALGSVCYVPVFYTGRVMTELPHLALSLLALWLFLSQAPRAVLASGVVLALATLTRFPAVLTGFALVLADVLANRGRVVRSRPFLASVGFGALLFVPYVIWSWRTLGSPLHAWTASGNLMPDLAPAERWSGVVQYAGWLRSTLGLAGCALVALGACRAIWGVARDRGRHARLLLLLWIALPLAYFGLFVRPILDRYLIVALPALLLLLAEAACWIGEALARFVRPARLVVPAAVGLFGAYFLGADALAVVRAKRDSYGGLQLAGRWIALHAPPGLPVASASVAQLTYYTARRGLPLPTDIARLESWLLTERPILVFSTYEPHPAWPPDVLRRRMTVAAQLPPDRPQVVVLLPR